MRPIQWHLKNNWRVPESLEKVIPIPRSLHPHLKWWLEESNVLPGQPLHPLKHALQIFTDTSKEGWGTLDKSLKGDRSLCPVRALRYYLERTSDIRQNKELVFVSFKKGFDKDISPATISSWIKQTVILCYELSDQEALTLHQVKAHDVRAFAASKAFQLGVLLEQILSACHWKSHNTFTQFYLKDVAWADTDLFHLGPVVAAQHVHHHHAQK